MHSVTVCTFLARSAELQSLATQVPQTPKSILLPRRIARNNFSSLNAQAPLLQSSTVTMTMTFFALIFILPHARTSTTSFRLRQMQAESTADGSKARRGGKSSLYSLASCKSTVKVFKELKSRCYLARTETASSGTELMEGKVRRKDHG